MKYLLPIAAALMPFSANASSWSSETANGLKHAYVNVGQESAIEVFCDVGINAPITAIAFRLGNTEPMANSVVRLTFDKEDPLFITLDEEGSIGSLTPQAADDFDTVLSKLKAKSRVKVRIYNGVEETFALRGSSKALSDCKPDYLVAN